MEQAAIHALGPKKRGTLKSVTAFHTSTSMNSSDSQENRVVLYPSLIPAVLILLLSLGIGVMSIAMLPLIPLAGLGGLFMSGFGIKCSHSRLTPGATWLSIETDGFSLCKNFRVQSYSWFEVDHFEIRSSQDTETSRIPMLWMVPTADGEPVQIPGCFGPRLDEMLALLNQHQSRSRALLTTLARYERDLSNH